MTVNFDITKLEEQIIYDYEPIIDFCKISFNTTDKDWYNRLTNASIIITLKTTSGLIYQTPLNYKLYMHVYLKYPVFTFSDIITLPLQFNNLGTNLQWTCTIQINNIDFKENEHLQVTFIDKEHILKRVEDWKFRVDNLYKEVSTWLNDKPEYELKIGGSVQMYEELMVKFKVNPAKIKTADIFKNKQLVLTFKPKGLWIIGANGGIDIITQKHSLILIDFAEQFESPQWHISPNNSSKSDVIFTKNVLSNLI